MSTASTPPALGMFLLPVEGFRVMYCLQVRRVFDCAETHSPGITHLTCTRWGLDPQGQPFDDGHLNDCFYTDRFKPVGAQAWRLEHSRSWLGTPSYFRQIHIAPAKGQQELFQ